MNTKHHVWLRILTRVGLVLGVSTVVFGTLCALVVFAAPGDLDPTFNGDGTVITSFGYDSAGYGMAIQPDGKIVVAGLSLSGNIDFAVARYNSDGSLDDTFDGDGKVTNPVGNSYDYGHAVAIQPDGKIAVAGSSEIDGVDYDFALARYEISGTLDTSFGVNGVVSTSVSSESDWGNAIAIQPDGRIVVAGTAGNDFAVARYEVSGTLDSSFGTMGIVTTSIGTGADAGNAIAIQSDGKIIVAGSSLGITPIGSKEHFTVVRYEVSGALDASFGSGGIVTTAVGSGFDFGEAVAIQSDGKVVVAGCTGLLDYSIAVVRYLSNGSLDTTFGNGGKVITPVNNNSCAYSIAIQRDGKVVVAGSSGGGTYSTPQVFAIVRYNSSGSLDTLFSSDGKVTIEVDGTSVDDLGRAVVVQADGKILVAGEASHSFAVVRLSNPEYHVFLPLITRGF